MALFGSKKNTKKEVKTTDKKVVEKSAKKSNGAARDLSFILRQPRITEKASHVAEKSNVYVFEVDPRATKRSVMDAVKLYYKEMPTKVNMVSIPSKQLFIRGKWGVKSGGKKAYVYFKKDVKIELI